eukprot:16166367-Heterocapsa_arctica.AAC.1
MKLNAERGRGMKQTLERDLGSKTEECHRRRSKNKTAVGVARDPGLRGGSGEMDTEIKIGGTLEEGRG